MCAMSDFRFGSARVVNQRLKALKDWNVGTLREVTNSVAILFRRLADFCKVDASSTSASDASRYEKSTDGASNVKEKGEKIVRCLNVFVV